MAGESKMQSGSEQEGKGNEGGFTLHKPNGSFGVFASPPPLQLVEDETPVEKPSGKVAALVDLLLNHGPQDDTGEIYALLGEISQKEYAEMEALYRSRTAGQEQWDTLSTHFQEANTLIPQIFREDPEKRDALLKRFSGFSEQVAEGNSTSNPPVRFDARLKKGGATRTTFNLGDQIVVILTLPSGTQLFMDDHRITAFMEGEEVGGSHRSKADDDGEEMSFPIEIKKELPVGNHTIYAPLSFSDGPSNITGTTTASFEIQVVDPLEEFKGDERSADDYASHRIREEVREHGMADWAQDEGGGADLQIVSNGENPGKLTTFGRQGPGKPRKRFKTSYSVRGEILEVGFNWFAIPENLDHIPKLQQSNYRSNSVELGGVGLQEEGSHGIKLNATGQEASFSSTIAGAFKIVAQQQAGAESEGSPSKAVFRQVVLAGQNMDALEEQQEYTDRMDEEAERVDENSMVPVDARHFDELSGEERPLRLFMARDKKHEQRLILLDMTKDAQRRRLQSREKGSLEEQAQDLFENFNSKNKYSAGHIVYEVLENEQGIPTVSGMFKTDGESLGEEVGKRLGLAGTVLSVAAMAVPVIGVPVAVLRAVALGAMAVDGVATAVLLTEHLQQENPSSMDLALDLLGLVGPLAVGGRKLSKALDLNGQKLIAFTDLTAGGTEVVLASVQGVEQIQEIWASDLSSEEKAKAIAGIVAQMVASSGMYAVGAKGDLNELRGGKGASPSGATAHNDSGERSTEQIPSSEQNGNQTSVRAVESQGGGRGQKTPGKPVPANGVRFTQKEIVGLKIADLDNSLVPEGYFIAQTSNGPIIKRRVADDSIFKRFTVDEGGVIQVFTGYKSYTDSGRLNKNLGVTSHPNHQAHHLISNAFIKRSFFFKHLIKKGIYDPDNANNGIRLPRTREDAIPGETDHLPHHNGSHPNWDDTAKGVFNDVLVRFDLLDEKSWKAAEPKLLRKITRQIENELRQEVLNMGPVKLN